MDRSWLCAPERSGIPCGRTEGSGEMDGRRRVGKLRLDPGGFGGWAKWAPESREQETALARAPRVGKSEAGARVLS